MTDIKKEHPGKCEIHTDGLDKAISEMVQLLNENEKQFILDVVTALINKQSILRDLPYMN